MAPTKVQPMLCLRFQINSHIIIYAHMASIVKQVHALTHILSSLGKSIKGTQEVSTKAWWLLAYASSGESLIYDVLARINGHMAVDVLLSNTVSHAPSL